VYCILTGMPRPLRVDVSVVDMSKHQPRACFCWAQLLGLDYLVDEHNHPWLLEVNGTPSLAVEHSDPVLERVIWEQKVGRRLGASASTMTVGADLPHGLHALDRVVCCWQHGARADVISVDNLSFAQQAEGLASVAEWWQRSAERVPVCLEGFPRQGLVTLAGRSRLRCPSHAGISCTAVDHGEGHGSSAQLSAALRSSVPAAEECHTQEQAGRECLQSFPCAHIASLQ